MFKHWMSKTQNNTSHFDKGAALKMETIIVTFIYSEKPTKFCEISTLILTGTTQDKSKVEISQNFAAFSEYMNFKIFKVRIF